MKKHRAVLLWAVLLGGWVAVCACGPVHPPTLPPTETDHTAQLQAAINKAQEEGPPIVRLEPGNYNISATLTTNGRVSFLCPSRSATLRWTGPDDGSYMLRITGPGSASKIHGLSFDGQKKASGIHATKFTYGNSIERCRFIDFVNGIHVLQSWGMNIKDCLFSTFSGYAIRLELHNGGSVSGCQFMWANGRELAAGAAVFQVYGTNGTYERHYFECCSLPDGHPLARVSGHSKTYRDIYYESTGGGKRQSDVMILVEGSHNKIQQISSWNKCALGDGIKHAVVVKGHDHLLEDIQVAGFRPDDPETAVIRIYGPDADSMRIIAVEDRSIERGVTPAEQLIREEP